MFWIPDYECPGGTGMLPGVAGGGVGMRKLNRGGVLKLTKIKELWRARSRLYRSRFLRPNTHFSAFFEIYKIHTPSHRSKLENSRILRNFVEIHDFLWKFTKNVQFLQNFERCLKRILQMKAVQKCENLVDLEKCWKMRIWVQKSASIQRRTSSEKFAIIWYSGDNV